jgi:signal transduction histidine kinase
MSIKARIALLLGLLLVAFLTALQILRHLERTRADLLLADTMTANRVTLQRWTDLLSQPTQRLGQDYSQWNELARYVAQPDPTWAENNLHKALVGYETHALWVTDTQGRLVYSAQANDGPALPLPLDASELGRLPPHATGRHFFAESRDGLLEVWVNVVTDAGPGHRGWLLVAKLWGQQHLATLGRLAEARIQLGPPVPSPTRDRPRAQLLIPLPDFHALPIRQLMVGFPAPDFTETLARDTLAAYLFVAFGLLVVIALWLGVRRWVLQPLDRISTSLGTGDLGPLQPLCGEQNELGRVARLVETSFAQQAVLQRETAERNRAEAALRESELQVRRSLELRARLARDLHDGVIQAIYAAGLGLESALSQLPPDQPGVRGTLQQCRQSLNDVIREVRGFIMGLEPEQIPRQAFAEELAALIRTMQALWPVRITLQVDPLVARRLNVTQEVHALQIVRECISNALRHGEAREIQITLSARDHDGALTVRDNGRGFDPTARPIAKGHGLSNIATRAREMGGASRVQSEPDHGTTVTLHFGLSAPPA